MESENKQICCIVGTRPEIIKMAPIIHALKKEPAIKTTVIATAQHREMLDDMLRLFNITADVDLNVMSLNQSLSGLTSTLIKELESIIAKQKYDVVLSQGDTTTLFASALVCFYHNIPFGHIEAGLRSYQPRNPFPEEMNRVLTTKLSTMHFAPTEDEKQNLLAEQIPADQIFVTGNTSIDALMMFANQSLPLPLDLNENDRVVLITAHRRENFGEPLQGICDAILELSNQFRDVVFIYPVHPNPNVQSLVNEKLSHRPNIRLLPPQNYRDFIALMKRADLILTDSGGLQEEAPALGKPVLVLRENTERPAIIKSGVGKLVGTHSEMIVKTASDLLTDSSCYASMVKGVSPYGDGRAAERTVAILKEKLNLN